MTEADSTQADPTQADPTDADPEATEPEAAPAPLLELRDPLPAVIDTPAALQDAVDKIAAASGPVAIDAERASGYRYSPRAYLIQLRREGAGTFLIDPIAFDDLADLDEAIGDAEWILHAATQDLACLSEVGLRPASLFDTEHAARLLGYPRVGLATLVETIYGRRMAKEHSAVDWSTRPLPEPWLDYAALDVEVLIELRERMYAELVESGKLAWAEQEFEHLMGFEPAVRSEPWRRTSGIHRLRSRRALAAVRAIWEARDAIAADEDVTPSRLLPDASIVVAAKAMPASRSALLSTAGFHGRAARRHAERWMAALDEARSLDEADLPPLTQRSEGPPQARLWPERDPEAAARLSRARAALATLSEQTAVPVENLLMPDVVRRVLWTPPTASDRPLVDAVADDLRRYRARPWQIELVAPLLAAAIEGPTG